MTSDIEKIRAACVKANPDRGWCEQHGNDCIENYIRLADVLLAISSVPGQLCIYDEFGNIVITSGSNKDRGSYWNPTRDDLTKQSPETIAFIASLV